jgi:hypothetical protein
MPSSGIDIEEPRADRGKLEALFHDLDRDEEGGGDFLFGLPFSLSARKTRNWSSECSGAQLHPLFASETSSPARHDAN